MKDSLFELLMNLFEKTITHLKEQQVPDNKNTADTELVVDSSGQPEPLPRFVKVQVEQLGAAKNHSVRVFTSHEQLKLTKASHQFLVRLAAWGVISAETLELVINRLIFSDSRFVSLQETKWAVRNALASGLSHEHLAFLDMILYHQEDKLPLH